MTSTRWVAFAMALAGSMLMAGAASAATVTATGGYGAGAYRSETVTGTVTIGVTPKTTTGYAGVGAFNRTGGTASTGLLPLGMFNAICIEFNEYIESDPKSWDLGELSGAPNDAGGATPTGMGARANDMARLLNGAYPNWGSALTEIQATALQLAVWEIAIESSGTYNLLDGAIKFAQNTVNVDAWALANTYLANLANGTFSDATMYYLALTDSNHQDFVVKAVVPLPAAAWLLLSGLVGLGTLARRRKAADA